jgi:hypothetical protein
MPTVRVADKARLLVELHEIRRRLVEASQRVERLSSAVKDVREPAVRADRAAS